MYNLQIDNHELHVLDMYHMYVNFWIVFPERDLQSPAVAAVLQNEEMSVEELTKVLQCLRLTRG